MDPGCRQRGVLPGRSCRPRPPPLTGTSQRPLPARRPTGHGSRARWPGTARRGADGRAATARAAPGPRPAGRGGPGPPGSFSHPVPGTGQRSVPRGAQAAQICLASPPDPLPDRGEPVVPGGGEPADRESRTAIETSTIPGQAGAHNQPTSLSRIHPRQNRNTPEPCAVAACRPVLSAHSP
jgi:hypothetical protein